jgi:hypothetical protein
VYRILLSSWFLSTLATNIRTDVITWAARTELRLWSFGWSYFIYLPKTIVDRANNLLELGAWWQKFKRALFHLKDIKIYIQSVWLYIWCKSRALNAGNSNTYIEWRDFTRFFLTVFKWLSVIHGVVERGIHLACWVVQNIITDSSQKSKFGCKNKLKTR